MNKIQLFLQLEKQKRLHCDRCRMKCWINTPGEGVKEVTRNWNTILPNIPDHQKKYLSLLEGKCNTYDPKRKDEK